MSMGGNPPLFLLYNTPQGDARIEVTIKDETLWVTQKAMAELFGVQIPAISKHLKNIFEEGELDEKVVISILETTTPHGAIADKTQTSATKFYNLDAIISVGYRVNSGQATRFRIWATKTLKEYIQKGFVLDDERLKQGQNFFGKDYFRELLERVRSIRASERRIWQQITDIFAECSIDYDRSSSVTQEFYATIQNKFHYAIAGQTAAEIIYASADSNREHMGLTTWKKAPDGRILKSDVTIAKNYLSEKEIRRLERAVTGYFDYIEDLIEGENIFTMNEFAESVNEFLAFRKFKILSDKGKISKAEADAKADEEYEIFNKTQKVISDFDKSLRKLTKKKEADKSDKGGDDE
ncbi:MAG: virulence RhuM family protein [Betaproteobacteria bacterium]|nr:virulence RhuM family protein [Betaproteobacteria bacterium]